MDFTDHHIALWSLLASLVAVAVSLVALLVALYAIRRSNRNSSAATLVTLNEGFRQAWQRFFEAKKAKDEARLQYELSELLNLFELACGIHLERSLVGVSRKLAKDYINETWELLSNNEDAKKRIRVMLTSPKTFEYIRKFLGKARCSSFLEPPTSPIPKE
jgi:hypothetical protein